MQSIAETCVRSDAAHLSINLVSEIAVPMFTTLSLVLCFKSVVMEDIRLISARPFSLSSMQPVFMETLTLLHLMGTSTHSMAKESSH